MTYYIKNRTKVGNISIGFEYEDKSLITNNELYLECLSQEKKVEQVKLREKMEYIKKILQNNEKHISNLNNITQNQKNYSQKLERTINNAKLVNYSQKNKIKYFENAHICLENRYLKDYMLKEKLYDNIMTVQKEYAKINKINNASHDLLQNILDTSKENSCITYHQIKELIESKIDEIDMSMLINCE